MGNQPGPGTTPPEARPPSASEEPTPATPVTERSGEHEQRWSASAQAPFVPYPPVVSRPQTRRGMPWFVWLIGGCLGLMALAVVVMAVILGLLMSTALNVAKQPVQSITRTQTFHVSGVPTLDITNPSGNIVIEAGSDSTVTVSTTASAQDATSAQTQRDLHSIDATTTQNGNTVSLDVSMGQSSGPLGGSRHVDVTVHAPQHSDLRINLSVGNLTVRGISGLFIARLDTGTLKANDGMLADGSQLQTSVGDISYQGGIAASATVNISTKTGSIALTLPADTATTLTASTSVGHISLSGWDQAVSKNGTAESVTGALGTPAAGSLHLHTDVGDISVAQR